MICFTSTIVSYTTDLQSRGTNFWDNLYTLHLSISRTSPQLFNNGVVSICITKAHILYYPFSHK